MIFQGRKPCLHSFKNDICFPAQPDICALTGNYDCLSINKFYPCSLCFFLTERLQIFACIRSARVGGGGHLLRYFMHVTAGIPGHDLRQEQLLGNMGGKKRMKKSILRKHGLPYKVWCSPL